MSYSVYNLQQRINSAVSEINNIFSIIGNSIAYKNVENTFTELQDFTTMDVSGNIIQTPPIYTTLNGSTSGTCQVYILSNGYFKQFLFIFNLLNGNITFTPPSNFLIGGRQDAISPSAITAGSVGDIIVNLSNITITGNVGLSGFMIFYVI
jgi:hypothetical protein